MNMGQLYIGYDKSGLYKIGVTYDYKKRFKAFRTGNPTFGFLFVFSVENPYAIEEELHKKFYEQRVEGEWFQLDGHDMKYICDRCMGTNSRHTVAELEQIMGMIFNASAGTLLGLQDYANQIGASPAMWEER